MVSLLVPKLSVGLGGNSIERSAVDQSKIFNKERQAVRPLKHNLSLPGSGSDLKPPQIFQHELLQKISINLFSYFLVKLTVQIFVVTFCFACA
ncbi:hypothetical protein VIGAN_09174400 [Vigna angularis var. angularis]|uniref:Uncharacterized protein n=1 Tax=Vigna angularis var. angularis TaxID=157739 RepID=A0A0S3SYY8_PHAAN|nr:hypothetical protein VIGAN_09174400 [Vigna angularis var. angularis]